MRDRLAVQPWPRRSARRRACGRTEPSHHREPLGPATLASVIAYRLWRCSGQGPAGADVVGESSAVEGPRRRTEPPRAAITTRSAPRAGGSRTWPTGSVIGGRPAPRGEEAHQVRRRRPGRPRSLVGGHHFEAREQRHDEENLWPGGFSRPPIRFWKTNRRVRLRVLPHAWGLGVFQLSRSTHGSYQP